jgi:PhoH-like ATPase
LYRGLSLEAADFWERYPGVDSWNQNSSTYYRIQRVEGDDWYPNQCVVIGNGEGIEAVVTEVTDTEFVLRLAIDYASGRKNIWGIHARNLEQNFAMNLLMDPDIDFVTLLGTAGTGKTLLTLAAGLTQTLDEKRYSEIIVTRATVSIGEDIGFLPGTEEEKMTPWMGALTDNLEVLTHSEEGGEWGRAATNDILASRVKIRSLNFMRGRTFLNRFVIIDEAQNITPKQMKALLTRAGPGTKMVCLGNVAQIDTPYLTETTSGLTFAVDRFKDWKHGGHITLRRGERSRLADYASEAL